jgi:glutathione synthase
MPLRVAVQMDPIDRINVAGDSTFALMLKAQELGHELFYYSPEDLSFAEGRLWTMGYAVKVQRVDGDHYSFGDHRILDLGRDIDVELMRQDPPFDLGYITATHLLERIKNETLIVNDPTCVRDPPHKLTVHD